MKEEKNRDLEIAEGAFFDGELEGHRKARLEKRFKENSPELLAELESLREVRGAVRNWFQESTADAKIDEKKAAAWERLERALPALDKEVSKQPSVTFMLRDWWGGLLAPRRLAAVGGGCALALALIMVLPGKETPQTVKIASTQVEQGFDLGPVQGSRPEIPFLNSSRGSSPIFNVGSSPQRGSSVLARGPVSSDLLRPKVVANGFELKRVQALGLDIDFVESENPFRIIATQDASQPPVIWVRIQDGK